MSDVATEGIPTPQAAAEALAAAVQQDKAPDALAPENPPVAVAPEVDTGTTDDTSDSLIRSADIDLSGLTPDQKAWLEAREKEMQAVITKRTQEAAEIAKQFEDLDPSAAREALAFYEGVRSDPNYAAEVYDFLTANLMAAGYSPAKAAAEAANALREGGGETPQAPLPSFEDDPDEAVKARLEQLDARQREIDARFEALSAREQETELINAILRQDTAIREAKGYGDQEMDYIYAFAESTGGDLFAAEKLYAGLNEQAVQSYLAKKETAPDPVPVASAPAAVPQHFENLEQAHAAALERLRTELNTG